jgi:hypothetical protein
MRDAQCAMRNALKTEDFSWVGWESNLQRTSTGQRSGPPEPI